MMGKHEGKNECEEVMTNEAMRSGLVTSLGQKRSLITA